MHYGVTSKHNLREVFLPVKMARKISVHLFPEVIQLFDRVFPLQELVHLLIYYISFYLVKSPKFHYLLVRYRFILNN